MAQETKDALHLELRQIEVSQRGVIRCNAYFGSHRGYIANQARRMEILAQLRAVR